MTHERKQAFIALCLLVPAPSIGTICAMWIPSLKGTLVGQSIYFLSKAWLLAFPLIWLKWVEKGQFSLSPVRKGGLGVGVWSGVLVGGCIFGTWLLLGQHWVDADFFKGQINELGIGSIGRYLFLCTYLALVNSLLEEYVWRWFVYRKCETLMGSVPAVLVSGFFFTIHHVFALFVYFDWRVTALASVGVFTGGVIWSWLYQRYRSIWPGYLSHIFADIAIFIIGWLMIFN